MGRGGWPRLRGVYSGALRYGNAQLAPYDRFNRVQKYDKKYWARCGRCTRMGENAG